ncbi:hypothetical protein B0H17DRAFT_1207785 [Mycena rosella]|uniref:Uncharacterized protein n=1 Tax=Mycena rosella TaxID=1033263 RepID=A0AAD7GBD7_MYCRO|nr:hypothetical protein B0H17DRAFT_1207785 [Mycena rosella]
MAKAMRAPSAYNIYFKQQFPGSRRTPTASQGSHGRSLRPVGGHAGEPKRVQSAAASKKEGSEQIQRSARFVAPLLRLSGARISLLAPGLTIPLVPPSSCLLSTF